MKNKKEIPGLREIFDILGKNCDELSKKFGDAAVLTVLCTLAKMAVDSHAKEEKEGMINRITSFLRGEVNDEETIKEEVVQDVADKIKKR